MCPIWPIHYILLATSLIYSLWFVVSTSATTLKRSTNRVVQNDVFYMSIGEVKPINITMDEYDLRTRHIYSEKPNVASVYDRENYYVYDSSHVVVSFNVTGKFIGKTDVCVNVSNTAKQYCASVVVKRSVRAIDRVFTVSVAVLVSIVYINFGCALDWSYVRGTLMKPVGPCIGLFGQFFVMPLLSYYLGCLIFPNASEMRVGLFFTGVSPAGGASNIWTLVLDGNINLSVTMTTISTFSAFALMPLWFFTLGHVVFASNNLSVPYRKISTFAVALVVPLAIGYYIQKRHAKLSKVLVRVLKPFSSFLIVFIVVFAVWTNLYLLKLFTWKIILAGIGLPWIGFFLGMILAIVARQNAEDVLAIAIETGVQNTGIAIYLLRFILPQPDADLTTVIPVAVAIMTPIPLFTLYVMKKFCRFFPASKEPPITESRYDIIRATRDMSRDTIYRECVEKA